MEKNTAPMLFPFEPDKFWVEMRRLIQEELRNNSKELPADSDENILARVEVAKLLRISLVTLNDWVKRGLPCYKQRGKVYFLYSEVMEYIMNRKRTIP